MITINETVARKVLSVVDAGLSRGLGSPEPGNMCVEAAVCFALGLPHGDDPQCVSPALRSLKIALNDKQWSSNAARAMGMRRLAVAQLGSKGILDDKEFAKRCAELVIRKYVPKALRSAASVTKSVTHKAALEAAAVRCGLEGTYDAAIAARSTAYAAAYAAYAANAAAYAAYAADAASAADAAAAASADAAADAAYAAAAASAASAAAAAYAAYAKKEIAKARDGALSRFAEEVVQILVAMGVPGAKWLELTEAA
jgi:hypothetical protein